MPRYFLLSLEKKPRSRVTPQVTFCALGVVLGRCQRFGCCLWDPFKFLLVYGFSTRSKPLSLFRSLWQKNDLLTSTAHRKALGKHLRWMFKILFIDRRRRDFWAGIFCCFRRGTHTLLQFFNCLFTVANNENGSATEFWQYSTTKRWRDKTCA